jgi:hypothetical protein
MHSALPLRLWSKLSGKEHLELFNDPTTYRAFNAKVPVALFRIISLRPDFASAATCERTDVAASRIPSQSADSNQLFAPGDPTTTPFVHAPWIMHMSRQRVRC